MSELASCPRAYFKGQAERKFGYQPVADEGVAAESDFSHARRGRTSGGWRPSLEMQKYSVEAQAGGSSRRLEAKPIPNGLYLMFQMSFGGKDDLHSLVATR